MHGGDRMENQIVKPSILPGFMELLPTDQILFNNMLDTIRKNYERFGFLPIDTPTIEKSEILLAKGGGDTEKQIYRFTKGDSDLSLRFDLTVPLARYVSQHFSELTFPFRRYHIGKVFRGERNQRGRFREFYQCDIDIIGNENLSIINDAEIPSVIYSTFKDLGFDSFTIKLNNRKILNGFFQWLNIENKVDVLRTIDKLDKIGIAGVKEELNKIGLEDSTIDTLMTFIKIQGTNEDILHSLEIMNVENDTFKTGLNELTEVINYVKAFGVPEENFTIDLTIARGLDYYTGTIYETFLNDYPKIGSVCSGGRYDNLAEYYTKQKLPGVGISIGLTRLFYQLKEANIISSNINTLTKALVIPMDGCIKEAISIANKLRKEEIYSQVYLDEAKMGKKFTYANKLRIPYVLLIGPDEVKQDKITIKNMMTGEQSLVDFAETLNTLNR
jgi:histidyl-tRNA synthetase